jgi:putative ABC transport system substrate-binding protein
MRRRDVGLLLASTAFATQGALTRSAPITPRQIGVILQGGPHWLGVQGLRGYLEESGLREGVNWLLESRELRGDQAAAQTAARELEIGGADLIVVFSTGASVRAMRGTARVPIVFAAGSDPVRAGLVETLGHPGGRITGVYSLIVEITPKRLELLRQMIPDIRRIVTFYNPENALARPDADNARKAAQTLGIEFSAIEVRSAGEVLHALTLVRRENADAFFFVNDTMVVALDKNIVASMLATGVPSMAYELGLVNDGALAGYGLNYRQLGRITGRYAARILAGAEPSDLPVEMVAPAFAINLKTARTVGLSIAPSVLAIADEVVE